MISLLILLVLNTFLTEAVSQSANRNDVIIDEILPDPTPSVGLPNSEFIELKNTSAKIIDLFHWKISDGVSAATILIHQLIQPDSFIIICPSTQAIAFGSFGLVIGVNNFPSLNNDEDIISLLSSEGNLIHAVGYNMNWYDNAVKSDGGWSLEMIDTHNPCTGQSNWKASLNPKGGSPGKKNSIDASNADHQSPALLRAYVMDTSTIITVFDESLDSINASLQRNYLFMDLGIAVSQASPIPPLFSEVRLTLSNSLQPGKIYALRVSGITDCSNNAIGFLDTCLVALPTEADSMDLVINEVLFNPKSDGVDYVEIFNKSRMVTDASKLYIANRTAGVINTPKKISEAPYLIFPGDYITVTEDIETVKQQYAVNNPQWLFRISTLPTYPDNKGTVVILNQSGRIVDEFNYDERWHFTLISNKEGVALERIDPGKQTQLRDNWTSAASAAGFGTPTYQNSQFLHGGVSSNGILIEPPIFSPDNDGYQDICFIHYEMKEANNVANVSVFDANGIVVRRLYNNITLSQKGYLRWDGLGENGQNLPIGIYIIGMEIFNLQGKTRKFKKVVTLAKKY